MPFIAIKNIFQSMRKVLTRSEIFGASSTDYAINFTEKMPEAK